jgi:hypothetical protein
VISFPALSGLSCLFFYRHTTTPRASTPEHKKTLMAKKSAKPSKFNLVCLVLSCVVLCCLNNANNLFNHPNQKKHEALAKFVLGCSDF